MSRIAILVSVGLLLLSIGLIGFRYYRERRLLKRLNEMLDQAISGNYLETEYDESLLSALEARLARFLGSSKLSQQHMEQERDKIKTLISDISHQTKTPVANIRLFSELLLESKLPEQGEKAAKELYGQAEKLQFLIGALVKMSRLENGIITVKPEKHSVQELIDTACTGILPAAKAKGVEVSIGKTEIQALYDRKWTAEALHNLLDNGVKYTPAGGKIEVRVAAFEMFCRIDIKDSGIGIDEADQAKIFTRFYRSADVTQQEGVGVGLFLAREIIAAQSGYIRVRSEKGKGSVFSVFLPI